MTKNEELLLKELRMARRAINKMTAECNEFDEGFSIGKAALRRIKGALKEFKTPVPRATPPAPKLASGL